MAVKILEWSIWKTLLTRGRVRERLWRRRWVRCPARWNRKKRCRTWFPVRPGPACRTFACLDCGICSLCVHNQSAVSRCLRIPDLGSSTRIPIGYCDFDHQSAAALVSYLQNHFQYRSEVMHGNSVVLDFSRYWAWIYNFFPFLNQTGLYIVARKNHWGILLFWARFSKEFWFKLTRKELRLPLLLMLQIVLIILNYLKIIWTRFP